MMSALVVENEVNKKPAKIWRIKGAQGPLEIPPGDWYISAKKRCYKLTMDLNLSPEAYRVHAYLETRTMFWKREKAVIPLGDGKFRNVAPRDIARDLKMDRRVVRRALAELEAAGLAERRSVDGGKLRNAHIAIYSWAEPRDTGESQTRLRASASRSVRPAWMPQSWQRVRRYAGLQRIRIPQEFPLGEPGTDYADARSRVCEEVEAATRDLEAAETRMTRALEEVNALAERGPYKGRERNEEEKGTSSSSSLVTAPEETTTTNAFPEPDPEPEPPIPETPPEPQKISVEERKPLDRISRIGKAVNLETGRDFDNGLIEQIVAGVRKQQPDATDDQIRSASINKTAAIDKACDQRREPRPSNRYIATAIINLAGGSTWPTLVARAAAENYNRRVELANQRRIVDDPNRDEYERENARQYIDTTDLLE